MKAKKYDLECHDSVLDFTHDCGYTITEIFFPDLDLFINSKTSFVQKPEDRDRTEHVGCFDFSRVISPCNRVPEENFEWIEVSEELGLKLQVLRDTLVLKEKLEEFVKSELLPKEED